MNVSFHYSFECLYLRDIHKQINSYYESPVLYEAVIDLCGNLSG